MFFFLLQHYMIQFCPAEVCVLLCRRLTAQQKALILAYAETESGVDGTVNGIASTKDGRISLPISCVFSMSQKKTRHGVYIIASANIDQFSKFLLLDCQGNLLCTFCRIFHLALCVFLHYLLKLENVRADNSSYLLCRYLVA